MEKCSWFHQACFKSISPHGSIENVSLRISHQNRKEKTHFTLKPLPIVEAQRSQNRSRWSMKPEMQLIHARWKFPLESFSWSWWGTERTSKIKEADPLWMTSCLSAFPSYLFVHFQLELKKKAHQYKPLEKPKTNIEKKDTKNWHSKRFLTDMKAKSKVFKNDQNGPL